jgi:hypothetical protein
MAPLRAFVSRMCSMRSESLMTSEPADDRARALNPIAAITLVLVFPHRTFERLRERPHWILPLVLIILASMVSAIFAVRSGFMDEFLEGMAFRTGFEPADVEAGFVVGAVMMALVGVTVVLLLESVFFRFIGMLLGGRARFRTVFSAVVHASIPVGVGALVFAGLLPLTKSVRAGANLAFLFDADTQPLLWSLGRQIDLFSIWFFLLLGIAAEPILGLPRRKARMVALFFALFYIVVMGIWGRGSAGQYADPYENWLEHETAGGIVHVREGTPPEAVSDVSAWARAAGARATELIGAVPNERIDYYVYPSRGEKRRITDNAEIAHGVEWANVVHVAWMDGAGAALAREVVEVVGARTLGNVYNPLIREGLSSYARLDWAGTPVAQVAQNLSADELPSLDVLVDPVRYRGIHPSRSGPAAGLLVAFLVEERGQGAFRELWAAAADSGATARELLESAFDDSLAGIDRRLRDFLSGAGAVPGG